MRLTVGGVSAPTGGAPDSAPVSGRDFADFMDRLGPFEAHPRIAVGVSGGRDSMALVLLAADWARQRGGSILALTVDHGLRAESGDEARQVAHWMAARSIPHRILALTGLDRTRAVEATARAARYDALETACGEAGILHLLVGHHQSDQAETRIMRRMRGSGVSGQAGMAAVRETGWVRILRPLLAVPRSRLSACLAERGQGWIEDPSNMDPRFARARLRTGAAVSMNSDGASATAARIAHERDIARLAASCVRVEPAGFAVLDAGQLRTAVPSTARGLISRAVTCIAGADYPPRGGRLDALAARVADDHGAWRQTLGGCLVVHDAAQRLVVFREPAAVGPRIRADRAVSIWDGRFAVCVSDSCEGASIDALGRASRRDMARIAAPGVVALPHDVRRVLPGLFDGDELVAGPDFCGAGLLNVRFSPKNPVSGATFGGF